jgi:hypothetical protein
MAPITPDPAQGLVRIHRVITRALYIDLFNGREYLQSGFPPPQVLLGYSSYTNCLVSVLASHHQGEDMYTFSAFRKVLLFAPYEQLAADHHAIEMLLALIPPAITELSGGEAQNGLKVIVDTLRKISEIWINHKKLEEYHFSEEALSGVIDLEEQQRISDTVSKYSQDHTGPPYWVVPFILYNLEPEDRKIMAANYPPMIIDDLVPNVWKDQWAPMKPFLLE